MNIALLIAGGSGNRMGQDIPKQFLHVDGCPIIIHTMQCFQRYPDVDAIAVVCLKGWETVLAGLCKSIQYNKTEMDFSGRGFRYGIYSQWYLWLERTRV